jgi:hypothetical protein
MITMKTLLASRFFAMTGATCLFVLLSNSSAMACSACYGDTSGSKMSHAAAVGIFAMVVIMFGMLGAVAAFGWHLAYMAKHPLPDYDELLDLNEGQPNPKPSAS